MGPPGASKDLGLEGSPAATPGGTELLFSIPACSLPHRSLTPLKTPLPFPKTSSFQLSCSGNRPAFSMPSLSPQGSQGCWVWAGIAAPRPPWGPADTGYHDHSTPQFPGASGGYWQALRDPSGYV